MPKCEKCQADYEDEEVHVCQTDPKIKDDSKDLKELVGDMPPKVDDAIEAARQKEEEVKKIQDQTVDPKGNKFDPNVHDVDEKTGQPKLTPTGKFKKKRLNIPKGDQAQTAPQTPTVDPLYVSAQQYTDLLLTFAQAVLGEEARPMQGERESQIAAWYQYNKKYGAIELDPIWGLVIVYGGYIGTRVVSEKPDKTPIFPRTRAVVFGTIKKIRDWVWFDLMKKPREEKKTNDTRS